MSNITVTIFDLDKFVLFDIMSYVYFDDLLSMVCTCKFFYNFLNDVVYFYSWIRGENMILWKNINELNDNEFQAIMIKSCNDNSLRFLGKIFTKHQNRANIISLDVKNNIDISLFQYTLEPLIDDTVFYKIALFCAKRKKCDLVEINKILDKYVFDLDTLFNIFRVACTNKNTEFMKLLVNHVHNNYPHYEFDLCQNCNLFICSH